MKSVLWRRVETAMLAGVALSTTAALLLLANRPGTRDLGHVVRMLGHAFDWNITNEHSWWPALFWLIVGFLTLGMLGRMVLGPVPAVRASALAGLIITLAGLVWLTVLLEADFRVLFPPGAGGWGPGEARAEFLWPLWADILMHAAAAFASALVVLAISRPKPAAP